jgi:Na+-driven multidrug efflux pump
VNERRDGFHGWVKWVVVIAALMTITDGVYQVVTGVIRGYNAAQQSHAEQKK